MSNLIKNRRELVLFSIAARREEISATRYVKNAENLTDEEIKNAERLDAMAERQRHWRVNNSHRAWANWAEELPSSHIYAWSMLAKGDIFADLLEPVSEHGHAYRPRLPGVTLEDVERRIGLADSALAERQWKIQEQG